MDSNRFGKALGVGAREAAKALVKAADAASAPSPRAQAAQRSEPAPSQPAQQASTQATVRSRPSTPAASRPAGRPINLRQGGRRFGEAAWGPFARLSSVLWLEVTGVLFGLFAAVAGVESFHGRSALLAPTGTPDASGRPHEVFALTMLVVFSYFTLTNFTRARRRGRP